MLRIDSYNLKRGVRKPLLLELPFQEFKKMDLQIYHIHTVFEM